MAAAAGISPPSSAFSGVIHSVGQKIPKGAFSITCITPAAAKAPAQSIYQSRDRRYVPVRMRFPQRSAGLWRLCPPFLQPQRYALSPFKSSSVDMLKKLAQCDYLDISAPRRSAPIFDTTGRETSSCSARAPERPPPFEAALSFFASVISFSLPEYSFCGFVGYSILCWRLSRHQSWKNVTEVATGLLPAASLTKKVSQLQGCS